VNQGQNTVAKLLADHGQAICAHIDRQTEADRDLRAQQQFKNSLFFPEILARQEQIPEAHRGTCRWIFQLPERRNGQVQVGQWSNFVDWLEHGKGVYWINGKAGSGKSTLMNYITNEPRTEEALTTWADSTELLTPSFFFWNAGTVLQKTYQGLLRSLLFQIADR
jgi:hypothetical protein